MNVCDDPDPAVVDAHWICYSCQGLLTERTGPNGEPYQGECPICEPLPCVNCGVPHVRPQCRRSTGRSWRLLNSESYNAKFSRMNEDAGHDT